jgi:hypothetical protein
LPDLYFVNLPRFEGHFKKDTLVMKGVSNEKAEAVYPEGAEGVRQNMYSMSG